MIVDGHLDLACNAIVNDRDLTLPVAEIRRAERDRRRAIAMTSLPDLAAAGVGLVFATLFAEPAVTWSTRGLHALSEPRRSLPVYRTPAQAERAALDMLDVYRRWADAGHARLVTSRAELDDHLRRFVGDRVPGLVILMEGADPVTAPAALARWRERGVRMIGLAWGTTRYAGGTGSTAGLTDAGRELLAAMADLDIVHDAAHLSEEAFWEAAGLPCRALCVTHAAARAHMRPPPGGRVHVPLNRHLSDAQIAEVGRPHGAGGRGVIGLPFLNDFVDPVWDYAAPAGAVTLGDQGRRHLEHVAGLAGWECVGIGSDVDAGYGRDETLAEVDTAADWRRVGDVVPADARAGVLGGNWLRFLRAALPAV